METKLLLGTKVTFFTGYSVQQGLDVLLMVSNRFFETSAFFKMVCVGLSILRILQRCLYRNRLAKGDFIAGEQPCSRAFHVTR